MVVRLVKFSEKILNHLIKNIIKVMCYLLYVKRLVYLGHFEEIPIKILKSCDNMSLFSTLVDKKY